MADQRPMGDSGQAWRGPEPASGVPGQAPGSGGGEGRRRSSTLLIVAILAALFVLLMGCMALAVLAVVAFGIGQDEVTWGGRGAKVGVVTVSGVISSAASESLFLADVGGSRATMAQLRAAAKDDSVKAVVLRFNSPGGSAAAAQAILEEVRRLSSKKPVVASMGDIAASGGYYVACGADKIVANRGTLTASIGVIFSLLNYTGVMEKVGLSEETRTSGPYKDTGSPWREMREDERRLLQGMIDNVYAQFVADVAKGRGMTEAQVRKLADGRLMTGEQAKQAKLVDELGNFHDAVALAGKLGKIEGEPKLKYYGVSRGLRELLGTYAEAERQRAMRDFLLLYDQRVDELRNMLQVGGSRPGP